jgi:hypothetical protein
MIKVLRISWLGALQRMDDIQFVLGIIYNGSINLDHRAGQLALPGQSIHNPVWKILWGLKIPSKVKKLFGELYMEFYL